MAATRTSPPPPPTSPVSPTSPPPPLASPGQQIFVPAPCSSAIATCSLACPELCQPPPPAFSFPYRYPEDPPSSDDGHSLSPLLIALISILAAAFLLVSYYAFSRSSFFRRNRGNHSSDPHFQTQQAASQALDPNTGLDESMINRIALLKYRKNDGLVVSTDCSVCLGEFREEESLRLLPECTHAFHVECIDKWLESHSNCPICRTGVISVPQPVQARAVPVQVPPRERENGSTGNVNGNVNGNINGNNGDGNVISVNNNPPLVRERERAGGLVVIVDPGQVGRVQEIIELGGDDPSRPVSRQSVFVSRDIKPIKSNLMR